MTKEPYFFIEQINTGQGVKSLHMQSIKELNNQLRISKKFDVNTVAIFKIYPHPKHIIAHYDSEVKSIIIQ